MITVLAGAAQLRAEDIRLPSFSNPKSRFDKLDTEKAAFRCSFADAKSITADGKFGAPKAGAARFKERYNNFLFDASNGSFQVQGQAIDWNVVRHGNSQNDLIAHFFGRRSPSTPRGIAIRFGLIPTKPFVRH